MAHTSQLLGAVEGEVEEVPQPVLAKAGEMKQAPASLLARQLPFVY